MSVLLISLFAAGCFGAPPEAKLAVPMPEPVQAEVSDQSLGSFFGQIEMVEVSEPTPGLTADPPSEGTAPAGALASSQEVAAEAVFADESSGPDEKSGNRAAVDSIGTITVEPDSVLLEATHTVMVTGADLTPGADMIVAVCQLGGDPIAAEMSATDLADRASAISVIDACDLADAPRVIVSDDGGFVVELDAEVGRATAIVAGEIGAPSAVFTPLYLEG